MISQTPWFERKFNFDFPVGIFPVVVERLRGTYPRLKHMLQNAREGDLATKPNDSWSVKEQVGHLYDLEELWLARIEDLLAGASMLRAADLMNRKTHEAGHNAVSVEELCLKFSGERNKLLAKVSDLDEKKATLSAVHPRLQIPMRIVDCLFFVAEHDDHHIARIRDLLWAS